MTKWEYKTIAKKDINDNIKEQLGEQGWELTAIDPDNAHNDYNLYVFKRSKEIEKKHDPYGRDGR